MRNSVGFTYDAALLLHDGVAALTGVGANTGVVGGVAKILDVGAGRVDGRAIVDVSAIDVTSNDEGYFLHIQGSTSQTFADTIVDLGGMYIGEDLVTNVTGGISADTTAPFHAEIAFTNEVNGVKYEFIRFNAITVGTTPSFTGTVFVALEP